MSRIVIRADGGSEIGYGHLVRTTALAEEVLHDEHEVTIATTTPKEAREIFPNHCSVVEISSRDDPDEFLAKIRTDPQDLIVTDAYPIDTDYQRKVREEFPLVVIQDENHHTVCAEALINGNLHAEDLGYEFDGDKPRMCLGPEYLLLRDEITQYAKREPPWRDEPKRAIVTMGGSDNAELTPTILHAFDGVDIAVDAIVGPGFSERQRLEIDRVVSEVAVDVEVLRDPDDLAERMFAADFAISTSSTTTYELLALGTPIVSCVVAENQRLIADELRDRNLATVIDPSGGATAFRQAIDHYLRDHVLRSDRRDRGRTLVDGLGAMRASRVILSLVDENVTP